MGYPAKEPYTWWWKDGNYEGCFDAYPQYRMQDNTFEGLEAALKALYSLIVKGVEKCQTHKEILTINKPKNWKPGIN
jgi:hypothetical protein